MISIGIHQLISHAEFIDPIIDFTADFKVLKNESK